VNYIQSEAVLENSMVQTLLDLGYEQVSITDEHSLLTNFKKSNIIDNKTKLFKIRRDIALTYKEMAFGYTFTWPIRLHGVIEKKNDDWVIKHLHSVDFFNVILEDK